MRTSEDPSESGQRYRDCRQRRLAPCIVSRVRRRYYAPLAKAFEIGAPSFFGGHESYTKELPILQEQ